MIFIEDRLRTINSNYELVKGRTRKMYHSILSFTFNNYPNLFLISPNDIRKEATWCAPGFGILFKISENLLLTITEENFYFYIGDVTIPRSINSNILDVAYQLYIYERRFTRSQYEELYERLRND